MAIKRESAVEKAAVGGASSAPLGGGLPNYGEPLNLPSDIRILIVGDTGSGKTSQLGLLAEYIKATEGKDTVVFSGDKGGIQPLRPHIELGFVKVVSYDRSIDPWIWISHVVRGEVKVGGKWLRDLTNIGLTANEGLTAFSELMLMNLSEHSAKHSSTAVGGESAWSFTANEGGESLAIASNTQSHYGLVQLRIMHEIWQAEQGTPSIWTAILARSTDPTTAGGILGGQTVGSKQGHNLPRWFDMTFRINAQPVEGGPPKHSLYLSTHLDKQAKGAKVIANARLPLAGDAQVDLVIEPADIVKALLQIRRKNVTAKDAIQQRIEMIRGRR